MGGFMLYVDGSPYQTLSIQKFNALLEEGAIDFPNITESEIHDRGQQSTFLTAVVMLQAAWFIIQCSPRFGRDLFVIHLECLALVLLIANAMLYILWWDKPLDIRYPVRVDLKQAVHSLDVMGEGRVSAFKREERIQKEIFRSVLEPPPSTGAKKRSRLSRFLWFLLRTFAIWPLRSIGRDIFFIQFGFKGRSPAIPVGALSVPLFYYPEVTNVPLHLSIAVASILGGALNSANFVLFTQIFPSPQARLAWKIGTFLSVGASVMAAVLHALLHAARYLHIHTDSPKYVKVLGYMLAGIAVFLFSVGHMAYIAGRFILIVDAFVCLKGLPESAVIVLPWTTYIPHLS
ncbi:hypothetical protein NLJ89_g5682 [Agrocybe chaxingu]|uniref:Uncharacterized protein n=1 Tax=Agrocybe chaxingu TaxID=84603 RepID=A0A9W8MUS8_9AGAR|nr:hypothetical protein NLJ89_g5682 [Agrocybe chaxingu]